MVPARVKDTDGAYRRSQLEVDFVCNRGSERVYVQSAYRLPTEEKRKQEMAKSIDMGNYYRIPCDTRDLNYDKFFKEGDEKVSVIEDYHSHNTRRLDVDGMKELLLKLRFVREDLGLEKKQKSVEIKSE